jgi:hypothetical protein
VDSGRVREVSKKALYNNKVKAWTTELADLRDDVIISVVYLNKG